MILNYFVKISCLKIYIFYSRNVHGISKWGIDSKTVVYDDVMAVFIQNSAMQIVYDTYSTWYRYVYCMHIISAAQLGKPVSFSFSA